jgi:hypothetical protein
MSITSSASSETDTDVPKSGEGGSSQSRDGETVPSSKASTSGDSASSVHIGSDPDHPSSTVTRMEMGRLESKKTHLLASMQLWKESIRFGMESIQRGQESAQWKEWNQHCEDVIQLGEKMVATAKQKLEKVSGLEATGRERIES